MEKIKARRKLGEAEIFSTSSLFLYLPSSRIPGLAFLPMSLLSSPFLFSIVNFVDMLVSLDEIHREFPERRGRGVPELWLEVR